MSGLDPHVFTDADLADLATAKRKLEYPSLTARITALAGKPFEAGLKLLPKDVHDRIGEVVSTALLKGLDVAVRTLGGSDRRTSRDWLHKVLVTGSGAAGGAVGLASLPFERPSRRRSCSGPSATSRERRARPLAPDVRLSRLEVLALGGRRAEDDAAENGYGSCVAFWPGPCPRRRTTSRSGAGGRVRRR